MKQLIKLARFSSTDGVKSLGNVSAILAGIFLHTVDDVKSCENILYQLTARIFLVATKQLPAPSLHSTLENRTIRLADSAYCRL